ncbi:hypothetical protein BLNAU_7082 [Blattamonas nauphoetae]|uniref:Uncharacterized protein n=1 Tax=Blattamonas nauphoetae TaxID=2049346 RepID=A0ABQ9Y2F3_9EUKA|nr:hypothetical protein BLNAU_7082 [Blattamonas nauphoetae]
MDLRVAKIGSAPILNRSDAIHGGAVFHGAYSGTNAKTTLKKSSFVNCSTGDNCGGSFGEFNSKDITISDCVFLDSTANRLGGATHIYNTIDGTYAVLMTNTIFQNCKTTDQILAPGGACFFLRVSSIRLDSLCFRNNQAASVGGHDMYFETPHTDLSADTVSNCVSITTPVTNRCYPTSYNSLLPNPTVTPTLLLSFEQDGNEATLTVEMDAVVSGRVLVLVSNENGTRIDASGKAPKIGRLLSFDVVTATSGSTIVSCGEDGLLQLPLTEYGIVTSSFFPKPVLITVNLPTFDENQTTVTVTMEGLMLDGVHTLTLSVNSSETDTIEVIVTFASNVGTLEEIVYDAETPTKKKLSFNTIYSVVKMEKDAESVLIKEGLSFDTRAEPERLTEISVREAESTTASTTALLTFSSRALQKDTEYTLTLVSTAAQNNPSHERTIKVKTNENGELKAFTAILYPFETDDEKKKSQLDFGVAYTVKEFLLGATPILFDVGKTTFSTPPEPPRIEECVEPELSGDRRSVCVVFSGRALKDGLGRVYATDGESFWESTSNLDCSSPSQCTASFLTGIVEDSSNLGFGQKYSIVSSPSATSLFVVNENVELSVPKAPIVTETETELNASTHLSFRIVMNGSDLPSTGVYTTTLEGVSDTIEITFDGNEGKSDWIEVRKITAMQFNKTYTLSTLILSESGKEDEHVLCSGVEIETPEGPTLLCVGEVQLEGQEKETAVLHFEMERMPVGSFKIEVIDSLDQSQTKIELGTVYSSSAIPTIVHQRPIALF